MIYRKSFVFLCSVLFLQKNSAESWVTHTRGGGKRELAADRVDQMDTTTAICEASLPDNLTAPTGVTQIKFYYSIESEGNVDSRLLHELDRLLFYAIGDAVLWCSDEGDTVTTVDGNNRMLSTVRESSRFLQFANNHRNLSAEEARRLGIISFNNAPSDLHLKEETCAHDTDSIECVIVEGRMALMAHQTETLDLIVASILDGIQNAMDNDVLIAPNRPCSAAICTVDKVRWLGTTIEEARNGGPIILPSSSKAPALIDNGDGDDFPLLAYAAIPMALLLGFALLVKKKKRRVLAVGDLDMTPDWVRIGTGDPPRHFHEGMYHYTRGGARYLSTNCPDCEETRRLGFSTDADLPTIAEGRLYNNPHSMDSEDASEYRKCHLINPNESNLAGKHSSIDVHQCTSATCPICMYRPKDVSFVASPKAALSPTYGFV